MNVNSRLPRILKIFGISVIALVLILLVLAYRPPGAWREDELSLIRSLWLETLSPLPASPSNQVAADPAAARLGQALFFDKRLSANGEISCAFCHRPELRFTDGLDKARALGSSRRNTPSIVGLGWSPWLYWDGRRDSLWSQSLSPLEDPAEQGSNRMFIVRQVLADPEYARQYQAIFAELPDFSDTSRFPLNAGPGLDPEWDAAWQAMRIEDQYMVNTVFANIGKVIEAYERLMVPSPSRFDAYAEAVLSGNADLGREIFSNDEIKGLRLFMGKGRCMECHNGPLFTNFEFHNTGILSYPGDLPDRGRIDGLRQVRANPFNCLGQYSDASAGQCQELTYARDGVELIGALKTPSLRNLADTAPYMHKGQVRTLAEAIDHYNRAPFAMIGHNEAENKLRLLPFEKRQLEAFLLTLDSSIAADPRWLEPPAKK